jgi:hypothetical protein
VTSTYAYSECSGSESSVPYLACAADTVTSSPGETSASTTGGADAGHGGPDGGADGGVWFTCGEGPDSPPPVVCNELTSYCLVSRGFDQMFNKCVPFPAACFPDPTCACLDPSGGEYNPEGPCSETDGQITYVDQ